MAAGRTVVIVVRSDFLDECAREPSIGPFFAEGVHLVGPLTPSALRQAIEEPAARAGLRLEPGLVELILRDASGETGALPLVSHALVETWLRREGTTLTVDGYETAGGISGAIAQSADRMFQSMHPEEQALCRSTLIRLITLAPDGSPVRRRIPSRSVRGDPARDQILSKLAQARLVSAEASSIVIAHESIATAWPRLHDWLEQDAEYARTLSALTTAADAWDDAGRPDDDLFRGARLQSATEWRDEREPDLTDVEAAFLDASSVRAHDPRWTPSRLALVARSEAHAGCAGCSPERLCCSSSPPARRRGIGECAAGDRERRGGLDRVARQFRARAHVIRSRDRGAACRRGVPTVAGGPSKSRRADGRDDGRRGVRRPGLCRRSDPHLGRSHTRHTAGVRGPRQLPSRHHRHRRRRDPRRVRRAVASDDGVARRDPRERGRSDRRHGEVGPVRGTCCDVEVAAFDLASGESRFEPRVVEGGLYDEFALSADGGIAFLLDVV